MARHSSLFVVLLGMAGAHVGGCAALDENQTSRRTVSLEAGERFDPVYHKTYITLHPMEIWPIDEQGDKTPRLCLPLTDQRCPPNPTGIAAAGTRVRILDLILIQTRWHDSILDERRYVNARIEDGPFGGTTVKLLDMDIVVDPRVQYPQDMPAHLTWIPNPHNVVEASVPPPTSSKSEP